MKKTSRRSFGKQLAGAVATLPVATLAAKVTHAGQPGRPGDRNQHDTPPPAVLMAGSWIFEARTEEKHDWTKTTPTSLGGKPALVHRVPAYDNQGNVATRPIHIAHIKVVDGSGEMLYRLDNEDKDAITVTTHLKKDKSEAAVLKTDATGFAIIFLKNKKLEKKSDDPSMDPEEKPKKRQRVRYKDENDKDGKIYSIEIASANMGTLYVLKVKGHKAAKELRVMCWWESNE